MIVEIIRTIPKNEITIILTVNPNKPKTRGTMITMLKITNKSISIKFLIEL